MIVLDPTCMTLSHTYVACVLPIQKTQNGFCYMMNQDFHHDYTKLSRTGETKR